MYMPYMHMPYFVLRLPMLFLHVNKKQMTEQKQETSGWHSHWVSGMGEQSHSHWMPFLNLQPISSTTTEKIDFTKLLFKKGFSTQVQNNSG